MMASDSGFKCTLSLDVHGRSMDGYHEVDIVLVRLPGGDVVHVSDASGAVTIRGMEDGPDNLVRRAVLLVEDVVGFHGLGCQLDKRLPVAAGLGGGSADAAAVVRWAQHRWPDCASRLSAAARQLGADVPFLVSGDLAGRAYGKGDRWISLPQPTGGVLVLAHPPVGVSTPAVYDAYDRVGAEVPRAVPAVVDAIRQGVLPSQLGNQLERAAWAVAPELARFRQVLEQRGAPAARTVLSGTGGTYVVWLDDLDEADRLAQALADVTDWLMIYSLEGPAKRRVSPWRR